mmetsp:Transcript_18486/g.38855  ORF Transcript_18486/g.38855 Transcript_18486/m.38855 type:complete len:82 (+) Transcript_18486:167-412(+)
MLWSGARSRPSNFMIGRRWRCRRRLMRCSRRLMSRKSKWSSLNWSREELSKNCPMNDYLADAPYYVHTEPTFGGVAEDDGC